MILIVHRVEVMKRIKKIAPIILFIISISMIGVRIYDAIPKSQGINFSDDVMKWEPKIQSLRNSLPDDVHHVGYVDQSIITKSPKIFDIEEMLLMQYSIAPVALEIGFEKKWIIGNFSDDTNLKAWLDEHIVKYETQDFGFGLYLIHKLEE